MGHRGKKWRVLWVAAALGGVVVVVALQGSPESLPVFAAAPGAAPSAHRPVEPLLRLGHGVTPQPSERRAVSEPLVATQGGAGHELLEWEEPDFDALVAALAHDNVPGNARTAYHKITGLVLTTRWRPWAAEEQGATHARKADLASAKSIYETFKEKLSLALMSRDHQQRQLASCLLLSCARGGYPEGMSRVLVEGLRYDGIEGWSCGVNNAAKAVRFFAKHPEEVDGVLPDLSRALASDDGQARFLAAFILGRASRKETAPASCPILIERLRDNDIGGDEGMARHSLYMMGGAALPYIRSALTYPADKQSARILREVEAEIQRQDPTVRPRMRPPSVRVDPLRSSIIEWGDRMSRGRLYTPR